MAGRDVIAHRFRGHARNEDLKMRKLLTNSLQTRKQFSKILRSNFLGGRRVNHDQAWVSSNASSLPHLNHGKDRGDLQAEAFAFSDLAKRCVGATFLQ